MAVLMAVGLELSCYILQKTATIAVNLNTIKHVIYLSYCFDTQQLAKTL
jgi:hypothetical protein